MRARVLLCSAGATVWGGSCGMVSRERGTKGDENSVMRATNSEMGVGGGCQETRRGDQVSGKGKGGRRPNTPAAKGTFKYPTPPPSEYAHPCDLDVQTCKGRDMLYVDSVRGSVCMPAEEGVHEGAADDVACRGCRCVVRRLHCVH